jgi:hypothetical protein
MRWQGVVSVKIGVSYVTRLTVVGVHRYAHLLCVDIHFRVDNKLIILFYQQTTFIRPLLSNRRSLPRSIIFI